MYMRKKYRVRRPRMRFGPILFPLVSILLLVGTVYGWMSFIRSSSQGFEDPENFREVILTDSGDDPTGAFLEEESSRDPAAPDSAVPLVAVPGGDGAVLSNSSARPDGRVAALPEGFGTIPEGKWILVDKSAMQLMLCEGSRIVATYPVGIGANTGNKEQSGDKRTPEGRFSIENIHDSSAWTHDYKDGRGPVAGVYGPWFLRLRMPWSGLGIMGTPDPKLVGKRSTRGSIRMLNDDIQALKNQVKIGTVVVIIP
jgi:lipoprotein-anchoring transpeptidase ErfK/SrfK